MVLLMKLLFAAGRASMQMCVYKKKRKNALL